MYLLFLETYQASKNFPYPNHISYFFSLTDKLGFWQAVRYEGKKKAGPRLTLPEMAD
jgi:hypothetical protein